MTVVQVRDGDPVEKALRKFRRKVEQAGIRKEVRKREYYLKPGEQRRVCLQLAEGQAVCADADVRKSADAGGHHHHH